MATFTIDLLTGKVFLFNKNFSTSGGSGGGSSGSTYPEVQTFSDLPSAGSNNGETYLVLEGEGDYVLNRKSAGLYFSNGSVWRRLGDIPSYFSSNNFEIYDSSDTSKGVKFETSGITSGQFRTLKIQDSGGTIAYLTDLDTKVNTQAFIDYTGTTAPNTYLAISDFNSYSATTLSLIQSKQDQLSAGTGINIINDVISINLPSSLQLLDASGGTDVNKITPTIIEWTNEEYTGTSINYTGGSRIYIQEDSTYEISYALNVENLSSKKKKIGTVIRKNGNVFVTPLSSTSFSSTQQNDNGTNVMPEYEIDLLSGDYIELVAFRIADDGVVSTVPEGSWIRIIKILN